jgi:hypothetical protein
MPLASLSGMAASAPAALARTTASSEDLPRLAADRLRHSLRQRHDGAVLADFLEDDLRTALYSLDAVRGHLEDVLGALLAERPAPLDLLEAGDDRHAQDALLELETALGSLRRRLAQAAARVATSPPKA